jgi:hypothetical protein
MIAGEPAISDDGGHIATMQRIVRQNVPPLGSRADWVPFKLAQVIDAGLTRDRDKRIPSAMALAARLLEAFPEAGSRPSITAMTRKTDISDLGPVSEAAPSTLSDPIVRAAAAAVPAPEPTPVPATSASPGVAVPKLADTANPPTAKPPASADPPSSNDDSVAIFVRGGELPSEIVALREKNKKKGGA